MTANIDDARRTANMFAELIAKRTEIWDRVAYIENAALEVGRAHVDQESATQVIMLAKAGDRDSHEAVVHATRWYIDNQMPLPTVIGEYVFEVLVNGHFKEKRGKSGHGLYVRNTLIRRAIDAVSAHGFAPTANRNPSPHANPIPASQIVAEALAKHGVHMMVATVEKVWDKRAKSVRRDTAIMSRTT